MNSKGRREAKMAGSIGSEKKKPFLASKFNMDRDVN